MENSIPSTMKAAAIDQHGGPEVLRVRSLPVPKPGAHDVLIRLETAGVGVWDPLVRSGEIEFGPHGFPFIIGNDGAGTVAAVGPDVAGFKAGDRVYAASLAGGFYAEYLAIPEDNVAPIPPGLKTDEAGALGADGITALRGLDDQLHLKRGEKVLIFGASGGVGHVAVQLAKRMGARVFAVASGQDGVDLVRQLGADAAVDGRGDQMAARAREFAPDSFDAALVLAHAPGLDDLLRQVKRGGRVAYPNGVEPVPRAPEGVNAAAYDGELGREAFERLNALIGAEPFHVKLWRTYRLDEAERAHREVSQHHVGKAVLRMNAS